MAFVLDIPVRVVRVFIIVDFDQRQQKEPRRNAERTRKGGNSVWLEKDIHRRLNKDRHGDAEQRPECRQESGFIEYCGKGYGRKYGAVTV